MIFPGKISIGQKIPITNAFSDEADGSAIDPTTVKVMIQKPDGTQTTKAYGTDADLVRDAVGVYYLNLTPDQAGRWIYHWITTGVGQAANQGSFIVQVSPFYDNDCRDYQ